MKKNTTWILIADGAHARILRTEGPGKGLEPAFNHEFATSHVPSRTVMADRPGSMRGNGGGRHRMAPASDPHRLSKARFAHDLARIIDDAALEHTFDRLVLVAPPGTLGALRGELSADTRSRISGEMPKDLTHVPIQDLPRHLSPVMTA